VNWAEMALDTVQTATLYEESDEHGLNE